MSVTHRRRHNCIQWAAPDILTIAFWLFRCASCSKHRAGRYALAETGYDAWLRYPVIAGDAKRARYEEMPRNIINLSPNQLTASAERELARGLSGMLGWQPQRACGWATTRQLFWARLTWSEKRLAKSTFRLRATNSAMRSS